KDMAQLVNDNVTLVNTMTNSQLDAQGVIEKYGIGPELIIDFLALMGDKSDNIPGVPGIGEKTAQILLQYLPGINTIYQRLDEVLTLPIRCAKSVYKKLQDNKAQADLSYQLATIKTDVELTLDIDGLLLANPDKAALVELFNYYGFKRWLKELESENFLVFDTQTKAGTKTTNVSSITSNEQGLTIHQDGYEIIQDEATFEQWLNALAKADCFAFDTETNSLDYMCAELVGLSFCIEAGKAAYLPLAHQQLEPLPQLPLASVLAKLKPILENPAIAKVGQNLKFDLSIMARYGIEIQGIEFDTMLESYI